MEWRAGAKTGQAAATRGGGTTGTWRGAAGGERGRRREQPKNGFIGARDMGETFFGPVVLHT